MLISLSRTHSFQRELVNISFPLSLHVDVCYFATQNRMLANKDNFGYNKETPLETRDNPFGACLSKHWPY